MTTDTATDQVRKDAVRWAERHMDDDSDLTVAEREEFQQWVIADVAHEREFRVHLQIMNMAREQVDDTRDELLVLAIGTPRRQRERRLWIAGLAASALLALSVTGWFVYQQQASTTHVTTITGMTRDIILPDESVAHLNTRTDLRWLGDDNERRVTLLEGEALFEVRHDPSKPFTVTVGNSEIRVLGTRFNIRRRQNSEVVLTVVEGTVAVSQDPGRSSPQKPWRRTLGANQQIVYNKAGVVREVHSSAGGNAALWREGILEYDNESLGNVIADLGRYTDKSIVVGVPELGLVPLSGQLAPRDGVNASLRRLEKIAPVTAHQSGDMFVLVRHASAEEKR